MRGCGKVLAIDFDKLSHRGGKLERKIFAPTLKGEIFLNCKGWKIVYCYHGFEITTEGAL